MLSDRVATVGDGNDAGGVNLRSGFFARSAHSRRSRDVCFAAKKLTSCSDVARDRRGCGRREMSRRGAGACKSPPTAANRGDGEAYCEHWRMVRLAHYRVIKESLDLPR